MAYPSVTQEQWDVFFRELTRFGNISASAELAGLDRRTVYRYRDADSDFAKRLGEAQHAGADGLEGEAIRRAAEGYDEPVFYKGFQTDKVRRYSDGLMTLLLKGAKPEKYRDRMEMSGPDGGPIQIEDNQVAAKLAAILEAARRRALEGEYEDVTDQKLIADDGSDLI